MSFFVKSVGYFHDECSWEPAEHLTNSADLIAIFHRDHPGAPRSPQGDPLTTPPTDPSGELTREPSKEPSLESSPQPCMAARRGGRIRAADHPKKSRRGQT
jgi:hypothetical protein